MKRLSGMASVAKVVLTTSVILAASSHMAHARDTKHLMSVDAALASAEAKSALDGSVAFYFGKTPYPAVAKSIGVYPTNKKTNSFNKSDEEACNWAFLSAMISLQNRAKSEGGDAVVNIKSYYKKNEVSYDNEFECYAGAFVTGVALQGEVVKLAK